MEKETGAVINVGNTQIKLGVNSTKYILGLYETAVANGTSDQFLEGLANLNPSTIMENDNTMRHIVSKFKHEVKNFLAGDELSTDLYHALFDYYSDHGEMPYGTMKGRDGDPYEWVTMRFDQDVHDYTDGDDQDVPALPSAQIENFSALGEAEKKRNPWLDLSYSDSPKVGQKKRTSSGEVEYTKGGQIHRSTKRYGGDEPENVKDDDKSSSGEETVKRGRGRPRVRPIQDPATKRGRGRPRTRPLPDANAPKRGRGRPKKVREWIETLRFVSEGKK